MEQHAKVYEALDEMGIPYEVVEHPPVFTVEEGDHVVEGLDGVQAKTLLLRGKKSKKYYMVIMEGRKRLDIKKLEQVLEEKNLHFCSPERLLEKTGLTPGSVSLFGLLNNEDHDINLCLDQKILSEERIMFHPNDNTKTLLISIDDMQKFVQHLQYECLAVEL